MERVRAQRLSHAVVLLAPLLFGGCTLFWAQVDKAVDYDRATSLTTDQIQRDWTEVEMSQFPLAGQWINATEPTIGLPERLDGSQYARARFYQDGNSRLFESVLYKPTLENYSTRDYGDLDNYQYARWILRSADGMVYQFLFEDIMANRRG